MSFSIAKRDFYTNDGYYVYDPWWIWRWVVAAIFLFLAFMIVFAYLHAHHRMKRGREPLKYHRWLVRRQMRRNHPEAYNVNNVQMYPYQPEPMYGGQQSGFAPPPPAYHYGAPPNYQQGNMAPPAMSGAKVDHTQAAAPPPNGEGGSGNPIRY